MIAAERVIQEARGWLGVPYQHQGRVRAGVDCAGLVIVVAHALGIWPRSFDYTDYGREANGTLENILGGLCERLDEPRPGCIVSIRWWRAAHHLALCSGPTLIHSHQSFQGVSEHGFRGRWRERAVAFYAYPGVES